MSIELREGTGPHRLRLRPDRESATRLRQTGELRFGLTSVDLGTSRGWQGIVLRPRQGRLRVPGRWRLALKPEGDAITLGPVIAILTSSSRPRSSRRFAGLTGRFRRFVEQARKMGALAYVFTPRGIDWKTRTIAGFTYVVRPGSRSGRWVRGRFPFPHVVYNRVPTRRAEERPRVRRARLRLQSVDGLHFFNPKFLDKWEVYQTLRSDEELANNLPETRLCRQVSQVLPLLERHGRVYLKMAGGSLGRGTARVERAPGGKFRWRATKRGGRMASRLLPSQASLEAQIRRLRRGGRQYLVQQAVPLLTVKGRPFDVRALVQKEHDATWRITGMAARIAGPGQITTHRPRGGSRARLDPLLRSLFPQSDRAETVKRDLQRVILHAAEVFDRETGEVHGELSMDIGIDREGHPWIFEINAKPAIFDEPSIRKLARERLLRYCFGRGGFPAQREPERSNLRNE